MMEISDKELIARCLEGDQDSFAELVKRYKNLVYKVVSYYIKDAEEVKDVSQEVFLKIYKALKSYNPQYKFSTWSVIVTKNLCLDFVRKKRIPSESIDELQNICRDDDTPESRCVSRERSMEIRQLISTLPEKYKTLIVLYHEKGLSYKEMAEKLNEPMSIIKNRLYRARLSLRESISSAQAVNPLKQKSVLT